MASRAFASSQIINSLLNTFNPLSYGAVMGGTTGVAATDLAIAQANRIAFTSAIADLKAYSLAGGKCGTLVIPAAEFLIASAPYPGSSAPSEGVSAVGGAHWRGAGNLPLSDGWSCHGLVFDGFNNFRVVNDGGRLTRIENDPYNTGTAFDDSNSTILVARCNDFRLEGRFELEGFQEGAAHSTTSGNGIDISYGCQDFVIDEIWSHKGTNALVIGQNRASGYSGVSLTGIDISQPCIGWEVGDITAYDGEHAVLINVADMWDIRSITHRHKDYTYGGVAQSNYIQRTFYALGCGRGHVNSIRSWGAFKAGVLAAVYPSPRTYADLDIRLGEVFVQAVEDQDSDYHIGFNLIDSNNDPSTLRTMKVSVDSLTTRGVKTGLILNDNEVAALATTTCVERLHVGHVDIEATGSGVAIQPYGQAADIKFNSGSIRVASDAAYSATSAPIQGFAVQSIAAVALGLSATHFIEGLSVGPLSIESGNRVCQILTASGIELSAPSLTYTVDAEVVSPNTNRLILGYCRRFGQVNYRTDDGSIASHPNVLEAAASPINGVFLRQYSEDPGTLAAGTYAAASKTVTGARVGMGIMISIDTAPTDIFVDARITANDTVVVRTRNNSLTTSRAPGSLNYTIVVTDNGA
jgi:hypothetical protein